MPTLRRCADVYLRRLRLTAKPGTLPMAESIMRALCQALGAERDVEKLTSSDWLDYCEARRDLAPGTLRMHGSFFRAMLNHALDDGLLDRMPCKIRLPSVPTRNPSTLSPDDCERLFAAAAPYLRPVLAASLYCGLRIGESLALRVGDVDLGRRELRIGPRPGWSPKSRRARLVPLSKKALRYIGPLCVGRPASEALFRSPKRNGPWSRNGLFASIRAAYAEIGIAPERLSRLPGAHLLRSTCLTRMLDAGVSVAVVSKLAGHSSAAITLRHYAGVSDEAAREAVERI